jgi:hypothetical protein
MIEETKADHRAVEDLGEAIGISERVSAIRDAITALAVGLTDQELFAKVQALNDALQREADEQVAQIRRLRESRPELAEVVEARSRILNRQIDDAILEGQQELVASKRGEIGSLKEKLVEIDKQIADSQGRLGEVVRERQQNYRNVFEEGYPIIRESTVALSVALCELLDKVWDGILRFETESEILAGPGAQPLVSSAHRSNLTPDERGGEAEWFLGLRKWFAGRLRRT